MREPMCDKVKDQLLRGVEKARKAGASAARIVFSHGESISSGFESGRLKETNSQESFSYSIDVTVGHRRGAASGNRLDKLDEMIDRALTLSKVGSAAHFDEYPAPKPVTGVKSHSPRTLTLTREGMIQDCRKIVDALKSYDAKLFISASAGRSESESLVITSGGVCHESRGTGWFLYGGVQRTVGTDILFAGYGRGWADLNQFYDPDVIIERTLFDLRNSERQAPPPKGKVKAYIPAEALWTFFSPVLMGINGRNVAKGDSPLAGRLGQQVLAPCITITDNPHIDYSGGACEIDGAGIPTRKQTLFDKGVLQRFLYDLDTAGMAKTEPTGNNGCSPYWPLITPGTRPSSELLAAIDDGIYIKDLIGFGQGNIMNGDFSCNVGLGYRIQKGQLVGRVKDTMVAGNCYDLLSKGIEFSSDLDHEGRTPHAVLDGISVSGH